MLEIHPFLIPHIVENILKNCVQSTDFETLRESRLVCQLWCIIASKLLQEHFTARVFVLQEYGNNLEKYVRDVDDGVGVLPFSNIHLEFRQSLQQPHDILITTLHQNLAKFVKSCDPVLRKLELQFLVHTPAGKHERNLQDLNNQIIQKPLQLDSSYKFLQLKEFLLSYHSCFTHTKKFLFLFAQLAKVLLSCSSNLQTLKFERLRFTDREPALLYDIIFRPVISSIPKSLQTLEFNNIEVGTMDLKLLKKKGLRLRRLLLQPILFQPWAGDALREFLESQSKTLEEMELSLEYIGEQNVFPSVYFERLQRLKLYCAQENWFKTVHLVPALEELHFQLHWGTSLVQSAEIFPYEMSAFPKHSKVTFVNLKCVKSSTIRIVGHCFPLVKKVAIEIDSVHMTINLQAAFLHLQNTQELILKLGHIDGDPAWDSVLSGWSPLICGRLERHKKYPNDFDPVDLDDIPRHPNLTCLTDLQYLSLLGYHPSVHCTVGDVLVDHVLLQMPKLQTIHTLERYLSSENIEKLQTSGIHIDFNQETL